MLYLVHKNPGSQTITVGGQGANITGFDSNAIQMAADALKHHGGGTILLSKGVFAMDGPVRLYSGIHLTGQGAETVLKKAHGVVSTFAEDVDYGVVSARVSRPELFHPGMGIAIKDRASAGGWAVSTAKITVMEGDTVYFDRRTLMDYRGDNGGCISNACSIIEVIKESNVRISNLSIDGNKAEACDCIGEDKTEARDYIDGCRVGAIYIHKATDCSIDNVDVVDFNGDGISWQITEDVSLTNSRVRGCSGIGLHPGSGTEHTTVSGCTLSDNRIDGMFVCWRVRHSAFIGNEFCRNGHCGVSIGHKDTDNLFESNRFHHNGLAGIVVRKETEFNRADRNRYRGNSIEDNGSEGTGFGVLFEGIADGTVLENNVIRDTGEQRQKIGIFCNGIAERITLRDNMFSGHVDGDVVG